MPKRDDYMNVASQVAQYLDGFGLAFKTYNVSQFDEMIKAVAGVGSRITGDKTASEFEAILLQRGFAIYPSIQESQDGYVRVIRTSTIVSNLLNAFRYPGPNGDAELARLLRGLRARRRPDDLSGDTLEPHEQ
jgi:hypothetical protein